MNGNDHRDLADAFLPFNQVDRIAANESVEGFEFTGDGQTYFADVVWYSIISERPTSPYQEIGAISRSSTGSVTLSGPASPGSTSK